MRLARLMKVVGRKTWKSHLGSFNMSPTHVLGGFVWVSAEKWHYMAMPSKLWVRGKVVRLKPD